MSTPLHPHEIDISGLDPAEMIAALKDGKPAYLEDAMGHLFSAAPDLLAALRPFANYACEPPCGCHNCVARAAIAKAEGQS